MELYSVKERILEDLRHALQDLHERLTAQDLFIPRKAFLQYTVTANLLLMVLLRCQVEKGVLKALHSLNDGRLYLALSSTQAELTNTIKKMEKMVGITGRANMTVTICGMLDTALGEIDALFTNDEPNIPKHLLETYEMQSLVLMRVLLGSSYTADVKEVLLKDLDHIRSHHNPKLRNPEITLDRLIKIIAEQPPLPEPTEE